MNCSPPPLHSIFCMERITQYFRRTTSPWLGTQIEEKYCETLQSVQQQHCLTVIDCPDSCDLTLDNICISIMKRVTTVTSSFLLQRVHCGVGHVSRVTCQGDDARCNAFMVTFRGWGSEMWFYLPSSLQGAIFVKLTAGGKGKVLFRICPSHWGAVDVLAWRNIWFLSLHCPPPPHSACNRSPAYNSLSFFEAARDQFNRSRLPCLVPCYFLSPFPRPHVVTTRGKWGLCPPSW